MHLTYTHMKSNSFLCCLLASVALSPSVIAQTHEDVDLGLSVNWSATYLDPEMSTSNIAYGYLWATPYYIKTPNSPGYAPDDFNVGMNIAATNYDPAAVIWGDGWRLPTKAECEELATLKVELATEGEKRGFRVVAPNGNSIFFEEKGMDSTIGYNTTFWTADAYRESDESTDFTQAYACNISILHDIRTLVYTRDQRLWIRPVRDVKSPEVKVSEVTLSRSELTLQVGEKEILYPLTMPENATNRIVTYSSSDENVVTVDALGNIEAVGSGSATVTATATDGSGVKGVCEVTVPALSSGLEIDLGLSTVWAAYNIGATSMTDPGHYFQFANPALVEKWSATASPYVSTRRLPVIDMAGTQYDPATVSMGSEWITPSQEQVQELIDNCDIAKADGGIELTSRINGAKIFFPESGFMYVKAKNSASTPMIMTSKADSDDLVSGNVPCAKFGSTAVTFAKITVTKGVPVRAVKRDLSGISDITADAGNEADVYTLMGVKVLSKVNPSQQLDLPAGIYIVRYASGKTRKIRL